MPDVASPISPVPEWTAVIVPPLFWSAAQVGVPLDPIARMYCPAGQSRLPTNVLNSICVRGSNARSRRATSPSLIFVPVTASGLIVGFG